jgi:hypothetical protein
MSSTGAKGSTQTNKSPRKGSNKKSKRQLKGSNGLAHRTVRCTRELHSELATFGNSGRPLRYNSPDCPVCQAEQRLQAPTVVCNATVKHYSARLRAQKSEQAQKAHQTVNRSCPVHHRTVRWPTCQKLQRSNPKALVTWLAHRTVRCAIRQKPSPMVNLVVGAINTSQPPHFNASKFSAIKPHTRALDFIQRHKTKRSNPLPSPKIIPIK